MKRNYFDSFIVYAMHLSVWFGTLNCNVHYICCIYYITPGEMRRRHQIVERHMIFLLRMRYNTLTLIYLWILGRMQLNGADK